MNLTQSSLSLSEAVNMGLVEHLAFSNPNEHLPTQYGTIKCKLWMQHELERILQQNGRRGALVEHDGLVALFVNDVGTHSDD